MAGIEISIIVITYNRKDLLKDCIASLVSQNYPKNKFEIIVIDDGSDDGTDVMVKESAHFESIRYYKTGHKGIPSARNFGIEKALGDIVAFVADDYILNSDYVLKMISFFKKHPEAIVVRSKVKNYYTNLASVLSDFHYESYIKMLMRVCDHNSFHRKFFGLIYGIFKKQEKIFASFLLPASSCAAFKKEVFLNLGMFDVSFLRAEDSELSWRFAKAGIPIYYVPYISATHYKKENFISLAKHIYDSGRLSYRIRQKHNDYAYYFIKNRHYAVLVSFFSPLLRAFYAGSIIKTLLFFPYVLIFGILYNIGVIREAVSERRFLFMRTIGQKGR